MIVTAKTVAAINGIRATGFYGDVHAQERAGGAYDLIAVTGGAVKASVDANGSISYPETQQNETAVVPQGAVNG